TAAHGARNGLCARAARMRLRKPFGRHAPRSIAARLTLAVGAVGLLVFLIVGSLLQWALRHELDHARERDVEGKAEVVQHFLDEVRTADDLVELRHHLDDVLIGDGRLRIWLITSRGEVLYGGHEAPPVRMQAEGQMTIWREDGVALSGRDFAVAPRGPVPESQL